MMKRSLAFIIFYSIVGILVSQEVSVALFYEKDPQGVTITVQKGKYFVYEDKKIIDTLVIGNNVSIVKESDYLVYRNRSKALATDKDIRIVNSGESSFFINYTGSMEAARNYDGWIKIKRADYHVMILNYVPLESYVAAIVEADSRTMYSEEYFKAICIVFRTATIFSLGKHKQEGFDFCDGGHCKAYKAKASNRVVVQAAKKTANMVMVDKSLSIIQALYHINSGGYTADGSHVLNVKTEYLKPVKDTFAVYGASYSWKELIPGVQWQDFLVKKGMKTASSKLVKDLLVTQTNRMSAFKIGTDSVKLASVRTDLGWSSSFFSMTLSKTGVITVSGRGSGHGAGLSLESAAIMASKGYTYDKILNYFYKSVSIVNVSSLNVYSAMEKNTKLERP